MKYVIKNCDNYTEFDKDWTCRSTIQNRKGCYCCQDCTDCVMKQIVELCEQYKKDYNTTNGVWLLANNITNLLDIQEV